MYSLSLLMVNYHCSCHPPSPSPFASSYLRRPSVPSPSFHSTFRLGRFKLIALASETKKDSALCPSSTSMARFQCTTTPTELHRALQILQLRYINGSIKDIQNYCRLQVLLLTRFQKQSRDRGILSDHMCDFDFRSFRSLTFTECAGRSYRVALVFIVLLVSEHLLPLL